MDLTVVIQTLSITLAIASIVIAILSYENSKKKNEIDVQMAEDKDLSEYAVTLLENTYKILTDNGENINPPKPIRLSWLTSARYILRYKRIREQIITARYQLICDENEGMWRHEFYKILNCSDFNHMSYFSGSSMFNSCENIEPNSAFVITEFSTWADEFQDPLDLYNYKTSLAKNPKILSGHIGLKNYLNKLENLGSDEK